MRVLISVLATVAILALVAGPALIWQIQRALHAELARVDEEQTPAPAVIDTEPGINLALQDECELMWSVPEHPGMKTGELDALAHDEQKGEKA
ncbi:hypothetical protein ACFYOF_16640 [Streptomyces sp. NPDC007148]|uniref:hypothetical protein n=1 Tax=Streptomyces sp. NPDC007148 TaxID=3364775 RepID=UPI003698A9B5